MIVTPCRRGSTAVSRPDLRSAGLLSVPRYENKSERQSDNKSPFEHMPDKDTFGKVCTNVSGKTGPESPTWVRTLQMRWRHSGWSGCRDAVTWAIGGTPSPTHTHLHVFFNFALPDFVEHDLLNVADEWYDKCTTNAMV